MSDPPDLPDRWASPEPLEPLDPPGRLVQLVPRVQQDLLAPLDPPGLLVQLEPRVEPDPLALLGLLVQLEPREQPDLRGLLAAGYPRQPTLAALRIPARAPEPPSTLRRPSLATASTSQTTPRSQVRARQTSYLRPLPAPWPR